jgi:hypothetical protein
MLTGSISRVQFGVGQGSFCLDDSLELLLVLDESMSITFLSQSTLSLYRAPEFLQTFSILNWILSEYSFHMRVGIFGATLCLTSGSFLFFEYRSILKISP